MSGAALVYIGRWSVRGRFCRFMLVFALLTSSVLCREVAYCFVYLLDFFLPLFEPPVECSSVGFVQAYFLLIAWRPLDLDLHACLGGSRFTALLTVGHGSLRQLIQASLYFVGL